MLIATFSGIRFTVEDTPTQTAFCYVCAFARYLQKKQIKNVIVGYDGRSSAQKYFAAVLSALTQFKVRFVGCVPTPTVQILTKNTENAAGVIITASHNDKTWCGLKFVDDDSIFLNPVNCQLVYKDYNQNDKMDADLIKQLNLCVANSKSTFPWLKIDSNQTAMKEHIDAIARTGLIAIDQIRQKHFKISFNAQNASGAAYAQMLCDFLNVELVEPFNMAIGELPAKPEPTPENLREFEQHCRSLKIDAAFAVDPDADRCVLLVDGKVVLEELTLAAAVASFLQSHKQQYVVKNVSTSLATDEAAKKFGAETVETAVGEVNVCMKMRELGAKIGGEGNGGVIMQDAHLGRDSLVAIMLVLQWIAINDKPLGELLGDLKTFEIVKRKFTIKLEDKPKIQVKLDQFAYQQKELGKNIVTLDGVKIEGENTWVHVRFSNTEPIVRIIGEAETREKADEEVAEVAKFFGWE